ncbi:YkvA family protein [Aquipseudomonas alcaligenes]|uniref:YkvA family protein n=1 Tax=Aquipseudomonas alcaligenes TaxID=43263 RepID=UPI001F15AF51|nr:MULTISPECIES: YkvA family protein [Pseudomonas]
MNSSWGGARYLTMARRLLENGRLPGLLRAVADKGERNARFARVRDDLNLLLGLCAAWWRGEYRAVGRQALLSVVAALLYFLAPLDMVPDWLPGAGLLDDLAVLAWVMRTWAAELDAYRAWREARPAEQLKQAEALPRSDEEAR